MSILKRFFKGFGFRTALPTFSPGEEITAYMTDYLPDEETGIVRIGDTVIEVAGAHQNNVDELLTLNITSFDEATHRGEAEILSPPEPDE